MKYSKIVVILTVFLGFTFMGYQCGSTELTSAKLYIQQKSYDKALDLLEKEVQKNPKSDEGYYLLGVVYGEKEQYEKMADAYGKSLSISNNFKENIDQSKQYYWATLFNRGVKSYQEGVNSQSEDSSQVHFAKAANNFENAINIIPDSADTYKNLAFVYMNQGNYSKAVEPLKTLVEKEKSVEAYQYLGEILYEQGNKLKENDEAAAMNVYDEAITVLEEGRKIYPNEPNLLLALSNSYIAANKLDVAKDVFKAGVEAEPDNKYYRYNYGVLLLGAEEYAEAEKQFLKAIEVDPDYENALYNLGVTYVKWGTHLNELADAKGETSDEYKEKYMMALPHLEKAVQMKSDDAALWELIGKVYTVVGMQEDALNAFNKADELRN
jgi:tetratricopeptide (TPR) repeat protein